MPVQPLVVLTLTYKAVMHQQIPLNLVDQVLPLWHKQVPMKSLLAALTVIQLTLLMPVLRQVVLILTYKVAMHQQTL